jgi:hypothetical protein
MKMFEQMRSRMVFMALESYHLRQKPPVDNPHLAMQDIPHRNNFLLGGSQTIPTVRESTMDHETRNKFEHYCALAEIEEDPDKFVEISRNIVRILDDKQVLLNHQRPAGRVRFPAAPSNVA